MKLSCKVLGLYLSQKILVFSCNVQFLEKDGASFFKVRFFIFQPATCEGVVIFQIFKLKK